MNEPTVSVLIPPGEVLSVVDLEFLLSMAVDVWGDAAPLQFLKRFEHDGTRYVLARADATAQDLT